MMPSFSESLINFEYLRLKTVYSTLIQRGCMHLIKIGISFKLYNKLYSRTFLRSKTFLLDIGIKITKPVVFRKTWDIGQS